jgi:type IV pilus assembly protein PilM
VVILKMTKYFGTHLRHFSSLFQAPLAGLDIGSSSLKWLELARNRDGGLRLERCAVEPLGLGWIMNGEILAFDEVAAALARLVRTSGSATRRVALAMPDESVMSRHLPLASGPGQAELAVQAEVRRHAGKGASEMATDFFLRPGVQDDREGADTELLMFAARKDLMQDRLGLAESAGLSPVVMDVASRAAALAACRLAAQWQTEPVPQAAEAVMALVEVGGEHLGVQLLYRADILRGTHKVGGGARLSQHIAEAYGLRLPDAEARKQRGELPDDYGSGVLQAFVNALAEELAGDLETLRASANVRVLDGIWLAGGSAVLPGLPEALARLTGSPCALVDPLLGVALRDGQASTCVRGLGRSSLLTACGLALRRFHP